MTKSGPGTGKSKRAIIHVGTEKTGTKSLQQLLADNREWLRGQGVLFPISPGNVNHTRLVAAAEDDGVIDNIKAHVMATRHETEARLRKSFLTDFRRELKDGDDWHTLMLSTELIHSRLHTASEIKRLISFVVEIVEKVTIIIVLRRQDQLAVSRLSTAIRAGHACFDDVFQDISGNVYHQLPSNRDVSDFVHYYDYTNFLNRFSEFVPDSDIDVRLYEADGHRTDSVELLDEVLDLDLRQLSKSAPSLNAAMSVEAQFVISRINQQIPSHLPSGRRNERYIELKKRIEAEMAGSTRTVTQDAARAFLARFEQSNEAVRARFFPDRKTLFDDDFTMYPVSVDYSDLPAKLEPSIIGYLASLPFETHQRLGSPPLDQLNTCLFRTARTAEEMLRRIYRQLKTAGAEPIRWLNTCLFRTARTTGEMLRRIYRQLKAASTEPIRWLTVTQNRMRNVRPETDAAMRSKFVLARIMGNDLVPRHRDGQMLTNLQFILENEQDFPDCIKLFVINRLVDAERETQALKLIKRHGAEALVIPFDPKAYADTGWDTDGFGGVRFFLSEGFLAKTKGEQDRMRIWACAPKVRYAMNINGARNAAIAFGQKRAEWTVLLDGNCIFTSAAFDRFRKDCLVDPFTPYVIVPMQRLEHNEDFIGQEPNPKSKEEPQIAFHHTAQQNFDETFPYGLRDKTVLLKLLGVPGPWQAWASWDWVPNNDMKIAEKYFYKLSNGGVFRLSSGGSGLELTGADCQRYDERNHSILFMISELNKQHGTIALEHGSIIMGNALSGAVPIRTTAAARVGPPTKPRNRAKSMIVKYDIEPNLDILNGRTLFIGLGAQKAGTSWVSHYLRMNPDVYHSPIKEMNFFNKLDNNPLSSWGEPFRQVRMREILLEKNWDYPPTQKSYETLKALAELGDLEKEADYLAFFARRIGNQSRFGEVCPQYALLEPQTYRRIEEMGFDTRLMFFMRDPTDRLASNIQHNLRRKDFNMEEAIESVKPDDIRYRRSNYITTMENFRHSGTNMQFKTFIYEDLFTEQTIVELCKYLGLAYRPADFGKQVNAARGPKISAEQKDRLRVKLDPLYKELSDYFGKDRPAKWRWGD